MSDDLNRLAAIENLVDEGDIDKAWPALYWVFCSTDLEEMGFYQTVTRLGVDAEQFKTAMLDRSQIARVFYYGTEDEIEAQNEARTGDDL